MDYLTNALMMKSQHNVVRRLRVQIVPRGSIEPIDNGSHMIQVLANDDDASIRKLNRGRLLDPARIDSQRVKQWIEGCGQFHGSSCAPMAFNNTGRFTLRLVDVDRRCLVEAPSGCRYMALSYTWGDPMKFTHLRLTNLTSAWLQTPGSLSDENSQIPTTIKDSLILTEQVGVHYLWIDAICIQQDDEKDKLDQIPYMDQIYGGAEVTIVAGAGDNAWTGLPGRPYKTSPFITSCVVNP